MKYLFVDNDLDFKSKILNYNHCKEEDLNIDNFVVDKSIKIVNDFKDKLIENKDKKFLIVGDFDCDGVHSTTIIKILFNYLNIKHNFYIPSRINDGYGLNNNIVNKAKENNFDIIFCLDNGIVCNEAIDFAYSLGLKVFIIDHHEYQSLPNAEAIIHTNLLEKDYQNACTAGLCYLLLSYFKDDSYAFCLAGIATIADMVKVFDYNRYLIKNTIKLINNNNYYQIKLLLNKNDDITYESLFFDYIPKLNSLSRMEPKTNINIFVEYLLSNEEVCKKTIASINNINNERKVLTQKYYLSSINNIDNCKNVLLVINNEMPEGLCGLLANRLLNEYRKPVIVLTKINNEYKGSARSLEGTNIYDYLYVIKDKFISFGGHFQALGLTISEDGLNELRKYIDAKPIKNENIYKEVIRINQNKINTEMVDILESLKPFGEGFKEPLFVIEDIDISKKSIIKEKYCKFTFDNQMFSAICFDERFVDFNPKYLIGRLQKDNYRFNNVLFLIEDMG